MNNIEKLPESFLKKGFHYSLVTRAEKVAVYEQKNSDDPTDTSKAYEVICISVAKPYSMASKATKNKPAGAKLYTYPAMETYPTEALWGKLGWTYKSKEAALKKFEELK